MWISKEGDVRRRELLDAALQLFIEKGYEGTSINDIIKKVGVTKGAFYYYFDSKEEVLGVLSEQQADILVDISHEIAADSSLSALQKLNSIAVSAHEARSRNMSQRLMSLHAYQKEINIVLGVKILEKTIQKGAPVIQSIIEQGIREGVFNTAYPKETAELYINLSGTLSSSVAQTLLEYGKRPEGMEKIRNLMLFYEDAFKRLLGITRGSLNLIDAASKY